MTSRSLDIQTLVSLPAATAGDFGRVDPSRSKQVFAASDPPNVQLGSGGGTVHLLNAAWQHDSANGQVPAFDDWLDASAKLLVHGSGESRRLPAYAASGKPLIPVPQLKGIPGQRPDQVLLDLQMQTYEKLFWYAPDTYRVMVTCGDVLLRNNHWLPRYPSVDVLIVGLTASPEEARQHGVMICPADDHGTLTTFLQKPDAATLRELGEASRFYLDTGVWLLSHRAVDVLMRKCGWNDAQAAFEGGVPGNYDLFTAFGQALGQSPARPDEDVAALTSAVLPLEDARFYHFGTNRSLLGSVGQLQSPAADERSFGHASMERHMQPVIHNAVVQSPLTADNRYIWIENSTLGEGWQLTERNVVTGVPPNNWQVRLAPGCCLDIAPLRQGGSCVRFYGFDDPSRGPLDDPETDWFGRPAADWFAKRGLSWADAGLDGGEDIQAAALFPVADPAVLSGDLLQWLLAAEPADSPAHRAFWVGAERLSSRDLLQRADVAALARQRSESLRAAWTNHSPEEWNASCGRLDLAAAADLCAREGWPPPPERTFGDLPAVHDSMFRFSLARNLKADEADAFEADAFSSLRSLVVGQMEVSPVRPRRNVLEDQIVWGRSPIRLDLAGGWTDTPPYCLEHGGSVVNVAADLNGQPPIQVFGRICEKPEIVLRSIDLGIDERISTYEELVRYGQLGSGFGIARAALALAGLEPRFHAEGRYGSLREQLMQDFGGGIELSMLAAIPKGSGLGTSSILAATLLGTIGELCGLYWDTDDLFVRTMALEQMLTSGGGWQDQVGGICPGLKLIETAAGLTQHAVVRGLPSSFFEEQIAARRILLCYTGITRVAHDILGEIVRGLFLNSAAHLGIIEEIGRNARFTADVIQRGDWPGLCEAVRRSWALNQRLDPGTNPPAVQAILERIGDWVAACKLLGAGGGGYLLILAKDAEAARQIRENLTADPPNKRARFVDLGLSRTGFQVTRS